MEAELFTKLNNYDYDELFFYNKGKLSSHAAS
jgi:hypothetical protein